MFEPAELLIILWNFFLLMHLGAFFVKSTSVYTSCDMYCKICGHKTRSTKAVLDKHHEHCEYARACWRVHVCFSTTTCWHDLVNTVDVGRRTNLPLNTLLVRLVYLFIFLPPLQPKVVFKNCSSPSTERKVCKHTHTHTHTHLASQFFFSPA